MRYFRILDGVMSKRMHSIILRVAPADILKIAQSEALQYVLDDSSGEIKPLISAAFYGTWESLQSCQSFDEIMQNGGDILENQLLEYEKALSAWDDYYGLNNPQFALIDSLFQRLKWQRDIPLVLSAKETEALYGDIQECRQSLAELGVILPEL